MSCLFVLVRIVAEIAGWSVVKHTSQHRLDCAIELWPVHMEAGAVGLKYGKAAGPMHMESELLVLQGERLRGGELRWGEGAHHR